MTGNKKFVVGRSYHSRDHGYDPVKVIKRTDKSIRVERWYGGSIWWMRIKHDADGNEYAVCVDGGSLTIDCDKASRKVVMTGPAVTVFEGSVEV